MKNSGLNNEIQRKTAKIMKYGLSSRADFILKKIKLKKFNPDTKPVQFLIEYC